MVLKNFDLVAISILYQLSAEYNKNNIDLYRDEDWAIFKNLSGPSIEKN